MHRMVRLLANLGKLLAGLLIVVPLTNVTYGPTRAPQQAAIVKLMDLPSTLTAPRAAN